MSSESRKLPENKISRLKALNLAKLKNDLLGAGSFLTTNTQNRLNTIQLDYKNKYHATGIAKNTLTSLTVLKNNAKTIAQKLVSHFIQVFNLGVLRDVFLATDRTFYDIDVTDDSVPPISKEVDLLTVGYNLIEGDPDRLAIGGVPMAMPSISEVTPAVTLFKDRFELHSTATDAYDAALEAVDALNPEADKVIKKIWDEIETYYNEESPESQRQNAREWGVIYVRTGSEKIVTGLIADQITGAPLAGVKVKFENGNNSVTTGANGRYELSTVLMDEQIITAELTNYAKYEAEVTLIEKQNLEYNITMDPIN